MAFQCYSGIRVCDTTVVAVVCSFMNIFCLPLKRFEMCPLNPNAVVSLHLDTLYSYYLLQGIVYFDLPVFFDLFDQCQSFVLDIDKDHCVTLLKCIEGNHRCIIK